MEPRRALRHLSFANVVSVIALFVALGGGTYAAVKIKANSVGSKQVRDNSLKGDDVDEAALGQVPSAGDAGLLDGVDSAQLARKGLSWQPVAAAHQSSNPPGRFRCHHSDGVACDVYFYDLNGSGAETAFAKDDFGIVHLRGAVELADTSFDPVTAQTVFTLPVGSRPAGRASFLVLRNGADAARLDVEADGDVSVDAGYVDGDWISLEGIDFPAAP